MLDDRTFIESLEITQEMLESHGIWDNHVFKNCKFPKEPFELYSNYDPVYIYNCENVGMLRFVGKRLIIRDSDVDGMKICGYSMTDSLVELSNVGGNIVLDTDTAPNKWMPDETEMVGNWYSDFIIITDKPISVSVEDNDIGISYLRAKIYNKESDIVDLILVSDISDVNFDKDGEEE